MIRPVWAVLALFRAGRVLTPIAGVGALAIASGVGIAEEVPRSRAEITLAFAQVVGETAPAVVNIYARKVPRRSADPFLAQPFFRFFFEHRALPRSLPENSLGSGVIVAADGLIVTNHHVTEDAHETWSVLSDRREFRAQLVGADQAADLALLDIEAEVIGG